MKLFSLPQISWSEPWFFVIRVREAWEWRRRLLLAIGISLVMFLAMYFFGAGRQGFPGIIGISLACGFVFLALVDAGNIQRDVTVHEDCIIVGSTSGRVRFTTFKLDAINGVRLMRPEEWGMPYGGMVIASADYDFLVAVPNKVSLTTLANILHRLGVTVSLSGWEPSASDTRIGVRDQIEIDPAAVRGEIDIRPVGEHEAPLMSPGQTAIQAVIEIGPLAAALIGAIVVGVVLYRNWGAMAWQAKCLYGGGALVAIVAAFLYAVKIGRFIGARYAIQCARNRLPTRPGAMFSGSEDDLVAVELFDRQSWTAILAKSSDYGFLRIDRPRARLLFEGNKFRWTLPFSAITTCRIEESIVGSEGNPNPEKRYYVVIAAAKSGGAWEAGMIYTRTELGNDTPESRYNRAQLLFTQLAEIV
jgi:hypothetical protein